MIADYFLDLLFGPGCYIFVLFYPQSFIFLTFHVLSVLASVLVLLDFLF